MKLDIKIEGNLNQLMAAEYRRGELAVSAAMRTGGQGLKMNWRGQVTAALGARLGRAVRMDVYPKGQPSLRAAALVYTKAPQIISAHENGVLIRANGGAWLAFPLPAAGKKVGGGRITPGEWQFTKGIRLRFVPLRGGKAMLVADDARLRKSGLAAKKRGRRRADGILTGSTTVPIFLLVRQVKLRKRLNLMAAGEMAQAQVLNLIVQNWRNSR